MSEHEQQQPEPSEEREETLRDLELPEEEGKDLTGGADGGWDLKAGKGG